MRGYFGLGQLSATEKQDILSQHKSLYNGYQTMQPQVSNTQPLTVYDFAGDKDGMVVNNKGEVKKYTNVGINEQVQKEVCDECGSMMMEGECTECGWKGEMGEGKFTDLVGSMFGKDKKTNDNHKNTMNSLDDLLGKEKKKKTNKNHINTMNALDKLFDLDGEIDEETGHLEDIYNVNDLGDNDFDYVEGGGNDYGTFEKMHHMKKIKSEQKYEDTDNEDDGFEDIESVEEMEEQGYTGGGNAPDMDVSNVDPAYDFVSNGPGDVYPESEMDEEYETMESAWSDDDSQEDFGFAKHSGDFGGDDSEEDFGFAKHSGDFDGDDSEEEDFEEDELEINFDKFDPRDKSWEEIKAHTGDWDEIDEDLQESFISQKNKVMEMMNRMKVIK